ncbi:MAG: hypothetical protein MZV70_00130 [Desulfobacterales bacterium]|nr:hypothetical protein [Desulfobacterales bacterium]
MPSHDAQIQGQRHRPLPDRQREIPHHRPPQGQRHRHRQPGRLRASRQDRLPWATRSSSWTCRARTARSSTSRLVNSPLAQGRGRHQHRQAPAGVFAPGTRPAAAETPAARNRQDHGHGHEQLPLHGPEERRRRSRSRCSARRRRPAA